jgi:hypothetical protein
MPTPKPKRVIPADVYDTIEFVALVAGGIATQIGAPEEGIPGCVIGIADAAGDGEIWAVLRDKGVRIPHDSDNAVREITGERPYTLTSTPVSFKRWAKKLNLVRGK